MALKTVVKVGEITNLTDARYCAGMEVDYLGFPLDGDKEISFEEFTAITQWVEGVIIVGEFTSSDLDAIQEKIEKYELKAVQVEDPALVNQLEGYMVFLKVESTEDLAALDSATPDFLVYHSNKDEITDVETQKIEAITSTKVLLGSGINEANCEDFIHHLAGIHLKGSEEIRPGYKDFDQLADILEKLEIVDY